jgi:hypothetical protein
MTRRDHRGYGPDQVREGEVFKQSPITGTIYRVTKWVEKEGGGIVALEKTPVTDDDV